MCFASGPIIFRVSTPRTGYRIQRDYIPVDVTVENGSNKNLRAIGAYILKVVQYSAQINHYEQITVAATVGPGVPAHRTIQWQPPPFAVPDTTATLLNCRIIKVYYFLRVGAKIPWSFCLTVDIPIVLGTPPLPEAVIGPQQEQTHDPHLGFMPPTQPQQGYIPYPIPPQPMPQTYPPPIAPVRLDPTFAPIAPVHLDSLPPRYDDLS